MEKLHGKGVSSVSKHQRIKSNKCPPPQQLHQITYFGTSPSPIDINIDAGIGYCD